MKRALKVKVIVSVLVPVAFGIGSCCVYVAKVKGHIKSWEDSIAWAFYALAHWGLILGVVIPVTFCSMVYVWSYIPLRFRIRIIVLLLLSYLLFFAFPFLVL